MAVHVQKPIIVFTFNEPLVLGMTHIRFQKLTTDLLIQSIFWIQMHLSSTKVSFS